MILVDAVMDWIESDRLSGVHQHAIAGMRHDVEAPVH